MLSFGGIVQDEFSELNLTLKEKKLIILIIELNLIIKLNIKLNIFNSTFVLLCAVYVDCQHDVSTIR